MARRHAGLALAPLAAVAAAALALAGAGGSARADGGDTSAAHERCATRLSIALLGESASDDLFRSSNPQGAVDGMLDDARFRQRFSRFVNAQFNDAVGETSAEDAPYWLSRYVLDHGKPWKDLFLGPYMVVVDPANGGAVTVREDPKGLGYFRSPAWLQRYAGNEPAGYKISTAYRMLNNTLGLQLVAATNAPGADISAAGRQAPACAGCHYEPWYALDKVARTLTRVKMPRTDPPTFVASSDGPQEILGGSTIHDDKELLTTLVDSEAFAHHTCRMAFRFLYGRAENTCEGPVFDACMNELAAKGTIQAALATIAKDPGFCQ